MKDTERMLRLLVDNTLDLLITYSPGGTITFANQACERVLGYRPQELIGMDAYQIIHPEDRQRVVDEYHQPALLGHSVETQAYRMLRRDGVAVYLETLVQPISDNEGRVVEIVTSSRDVTSRHHLQHRLDATLQELQFDKIAMEQHAIISITDPHGTITHVNDKFCALSQYSRSELIGRKHSLLSSGQHPASFFGELWDTIRRGKVWQGEICNRARDGKFFWMQTTIVPFLDTQGVPYQYVSIRSDITHLKEAKEVLHRDHAKLEKLVADRSLQLQMQYQELQQSHSRWREAERQLLQSEKMAAVGQLAAGVAHEINNPIGYVSTNLNALREYFMQLLKLVTCYETIEPLIDTELQRQLRLARQEVELEYLRQDLPALLAESEEGIGRVRAIVQDLKTFTHVDAQEQWRHADLHQCLDSTLRLARNAMQGRCEIVKTYGELPRIECMPSRLNQVFMNMLVNAAQAIDKNGVIHLRTFREGDAVCVEIEDNGCGIAQEHRPHLFEPFFTTKPVGKGTGLGLAISHGIIEQHNGRIEVQSEVGKGTRFSIWLPIEQAAGKHTFGMERRPHLSLVANNDRGAVG